MPVIAGLVIVGECGGSPAPGGSIDGFRLIYLHASSVLARRSDPARLEFGGDPSPLVEQVQVAGRTASGNWAERREVGEPKLFG